MFNITELLDRMVAYFATRGFVSSYTLDPIASEVKFTIRKGTNCYTEVIPSSSYRHTYIHTEEFTESLCDNMILSFETRFTKSIVPKCKYYTPYMDTLKQIVERYYKLDGCSSGGPLHILLDDNNYDIKSIRFCMDECFKHLETTSRYPLSAHILGIMICNEYTKMSLEERATFDALLCGDRLDCRGNCDICPVLGELYENMKEAEEICNAN